MTTNTNFQNLKCLLDIYEPETHGIISETEHDLITKQLEIREMNVIELRNLRDFVVLYLSNKTKSIDNAIVLEYMDKMSAITYVIDQAIVNQGGEI